MLEPFKNTSVFLRFLNKAYRTKPEVFVFSFSFLFYLFLWILNPSNKIIAASFFILIVIFYYRLKNIRLSVLLSYLVSIIIFTGKRYLIELIPPGIFPEEVFPHGYVVFFIISPQHVLAFFLALFLVRDLIKSKYKLFGVNKADFLVVLFFLWLLISDLFGSKRPEVSLLFSISSLSMLILYIYMRAYVKNRTRFFLLLIGLFTAQIFFESIISFQQFMASSPVFKNVEIQVDIEYFGQATDEPQFRFRPLGTFGHANILGMWMSFWLLNLFTYLFKKPSYLLYTTFLLGIVTLVMTLSRSSWLGFGLGFLFVLFVLNKKKKVKIPKIFIRNFLTSLIIASLLIVFFILPRIEKSIYSFDEGGGYLRTLQIQETLGLIASNPIFGVGTAMSVVEGFSFSPSSVFATVALVVHNWYLLLAAEHGLPSLFIFLLFLIISFRKNLSLIWRQKMSSLEQFSRLGVIGGVFSLLVVGIFHPFIGEMMILLSFGILGESK